MLQSSFPDTCLAVPPLLCAEIGVYALIHAYGSSHIDTGRRFDKRFKATHRFTIADTRGRLDLTVPIAKPASSACSWSDVKVSTHGAWWDVHRIALESAYGRTPYFEFYIDRFLPMLTEGVEQRFPTITGLSAAWDAEIRKILLLPQACLTTDIPEPCLTTETPPRNLTLNEIINDENSAKLTLSEIKTDKTVISLDTLKLPPTLPYYQVRQQSLGFIPDLSILDLIFNLGPEATLYLDKLPL